MYKTKFLAFAAVAILLAGVLSSVVGQKISEPPAPVGPPVPAETVNGTDISKVSAIELSPGETNFAVATTYGATYCGQTSNDLSGSLFISMNHTLAKGTPFREADRPQPISQTSAITGGSWTRLIFEKGRYAGSVYGRIVGGTLVWSPTDLTATISLELAVDNGTESFVGSTGKGRFEGKLDRMSKVATVFGLLTLEY